MHKIVLILAMCFISNLAVSEEVITLESTVKGNQEQPKVLYIIPWQSPNDKIGLGQVLQNQSEDVFSHIDRNEFIRYINYVNELSAESKK